MIIKTNEYLPEFIFSANGEGFTMFDGLVKLDRSNLICIAARPGMGKTSLALHMALEYANKNDKAVYIFSQEMSAEQIYSRMLCYIAEVDSYNLKSLELSDTETERLAAAIERLQKLNIIINDEAFLTVSQMEEQLQNIDNLGFVVIDYLQLLKANEIREKGEQEISETSRSLKILAKKKNIPIAIISQLGRWIESRRDKRPMLSDLTRTVGGGDSDLDTAIFIYREEYYELEEGDKNYTEAEICIAKNRFASTGTLKYKWQGRFTKFSRVDI